MDFGVNKTLIEVIKEGAFGGIFFRNFYWYRKTWEEFDKVKNIDPKYYCSNYYQ